MDVFPSLANVWGSMFHRSCAQVWLQRVWIPLRCFASRGTARTPRLSSWLCHAEVKGGDAEILMELWEAVRVPSKIAVSRMATFDACDAVLAVSENRKRKAAHVEQPASTPSLPVHSVSDRRWPVKLGTSSRFEGDPHARHRAEMDARSKALHA